MLKRKQKKQGLWQRVKSWVSDHPVVFSSGVAFLIGSIATFEHWHLLLWAHSTIHGGVAKVSDLEIASAILRNVGLLMAALIGFPVLIWRGIVAEKGLLQDRHGLLQDRYQKGADMLGSENRATRLAGIYALEKLASEHAVEYHIQILESLCAFARDHQNEKQQIDAKKTQTKGAKSELDDILPSIKNCPEETSAIAAFLRNRSAQQKNLENAQKERESHELDRWRLNLKNANFSSADLYYADLSDANLEDTDLSHADLRHADLSGSIIFRANLYQAILDKADLSHIRVFAPEKNPMWRKEDDPINSGDLRINLCRAFLIEADLSNAVISYADFSKAVFENANMSKAIIKHSIFSKAHLTEADLSDANLDGSDLTNTDMFGADLTSADLAKAKNLTQEQLDTAKAKRGYPPKLPSGLIFREENYYD